MTAGNGYTSKLGSSENVAGEAITSELLNVHTCLPGIVQKFNPELQTVEVIPAIKKLLVDGGELTLPPCVDVPAYFLGAEDYFVTFEVLPGAECLLVFAERCIDGWFETGQPSPPLDYRLHDLSDAYALIGVRSKPKVIPGFVNDGISIRNRNGDTFLSILRDGSVRQQTSGGWTQLTAAGQFLINAPAGVWINGNTLLLGGLASLPANGNPGNASFAATVTAYALEASVSLKVNNKEVDEHTHSNPEGGNVGEF